MRDDEVVEKQVRILIFDNADFSRIDQRALSKAEESVDGHSSGEGRLKAMKE